MHQTNLTIHSSIQKTSFLFAILSSTFLLTSCDESRYRIEEKGSYSSEWVHENGEVKKTFKGNYSGSWELRSSPPLPDHKD